MEVYELEATDRKDFKQIQESRWFWWDAKLHIRGWGDDREKSSCYDQRTGRLHDVYGRIGHFRQTTPSLHGAFRPNRPYPHYRNESEAPLNIEAMTHAKRQIVHHSPQLSQLYPFRDSCRGL